MLSSFRNLSNSLTGKIVGIVFLVLIVAGFAAGDMQNIVGIGGGGANSQTLAEVGDEELDQRDFQNVAQQMLTNVRAQAPDANYSDLGPRLPLLIDSMISERALSSFARENGISPSKRMIDAQIAQIPAALGADGRFSEAAYAAFLRNSRLRDSEIRRLFATQIDQQLLIGPATASQRAPNKMARAYASMLREQRTGTAAVLPLTAFLDGLDPTEEDLVAFYDRNKANYTIPEQRSLVIGKLGRDDVEVAAASDEEVASYLAANEAELGGAETRSIAQLVFADQASATKVAAAANAGATLAQAATQGGKAASDVARVDLNRQQYEGAVGAATSDAVFAASEGDVVGPLRTNVGWIVATVEKVTGSAISRTEALAKARERILDERRANAIADLAGEFEDMIADGSSLAEAAKAKGLTIVRSPLITASGRQIGNSDYRIPEEFASVLRSGFQLDRDEDPVLEPNATNDGYLIVAVDEIVEAAPAPLADVKDAVRDEWLVERAQALAASAASELVATVKAGKSLEEAVAALGNKDIQTNPMGARRLDLEGANADALPALRMLFSLPIKGTGLVRDPGGRGFVVVHVAGTKPGDALGDPALVQRARAGFQQNMTRELGDQFVAAIREEVGVERNEAAISKTLGDLIANDN